ncbi:MAG: DUF86 domain-containing protein [Synergistaceae bacterium]|nr:DUF86 domain-containing protein [Synergistaceae bacterium]
MNMRDRTHIDRIKKELCFIKRTTGQISKEKFLSDDVFQHAISMSLITIGECANHLSEEFKEHHPQIQWIQIIAVRNIASHGYWQLDMKQIWKAVEEDIPELMEFFLKF